MDFSFTPTEEAFRQELRSFCAQHVTPQVIQQTRNGTLHNWELHKKIAQRGWLWSAIPKELGGGGRSPMELAIFTEELQLAGAPIDGIGNIILVASVILELGNEFLKSEVVPKLLGGQSLVSLGYSEPEAGSDVAACRTRAELDGNIWRINGQKMWTTLAHEADYVILLTRTDPQAPKHRGLTMFILPLDSLGVEIQPVHTIGPERTNATFYDDVCVEDRWRIGEVNAGWQVMLACLKYERGFAGGQYFSVPLVAAARKYAESYLSPGGEQPSQTQKDGTQTSNTQAARARLIDNPVLREQLIRAMIDIEACRLLAYRTAALASSGEQFGVEGSMTKLFASEKYQQHCEWFLNMQGPQGLLQWGTDETLEDGLLEESWRHAPVTTIYGGTSEIQRNNIAEHRLGLPRSR